MGSNGVITNYTDSYTITKETKDIDYITCSGDYSLISDTAIRVGYTNEYPTINGTGVRNASNLEKARPTLKVDKNYKYVTLFVLVSYTHTIDEIKDKFQIEFNSTATDYEPYKEQIVPLDLKGNFVGAINDNIRDYLVTDKKKYWLVKGITKYVFTGNEPFSNEYGESLFTLARFFDNKPFLVGYGLSNYYIYNPIQSGVDANTKHGDFALQISINGTAYSIHFKNTDYNNVENFKADLKEKYNNGTPVEVYYPTKETEIIELGELPEPIKTFEGVNNIQLLGNLDTEIEVKYALDVKKYFENKLASIQEQIL